MSAVEKIVGYRLPKDELSRHRQFRSIAIISGVAIGAAMGVGVYSANQPPKESDRTIVKIDHESLTPGDDICTAAEDLSKKRGVGFNYDECSNDLSRVDLSENDAVVVWTSTAIIGPVDSGGLGINVPGIHTSVDKQIEEARPKRQYRLN